MADQFISVATGQTNPYGLAEELVQDLWDTAVGLALREIPTARQFIDKRPQSPMARGSSITLEKFEWLSDSQVTGATTPLTEESDVEAIAPPKPSTVTLTPNEYGTVFVQTRKFKNRTFAPVDPLAAAALADHMGRTIDTLVQNVMVTGTNVDYAGDAAAVNQIDNGDKLTAADVRRAVTRLRTAKALPWFGQLYAGFIHPHTELDLREESGAGSWRTPQEYGVSQDRIWAGEVGVFEGVRFVVNALVRTGADGAAGATTYQNYFIGRNALAEIVYEEPHVVISPQVDRLNRFFGIGWYGDLGFGVYENKALQRVVSGSSLGDDL